MFFLILLLSVSGIAQSALDSLQSDILLRTFIESDNVPLNREVVYHVELRWQGDLNKFRITQIMDPTLTNLSIRGTGSSNKVDTSPDGEMTSVKRITFYLSPLTIGMSYIDGVTIKYSQQDAAYESSLISSRIGVKIVEPLPEPGDSPLWPILFWATIIVIVTAVTIYFYQRYQKRKEAEREARLAEKKETSEEKYLRLLRETVHFESDNKKESLSDLAHLLTGYFSEVYDFPAGNLSTSAIIDILREKNLSEENLARASEFFNRADMVKFAGEVVEDSEFHRLYDTVELVIENQSKRRIDES